MKSIAALIIILVLCAGGCANEGSEQRKRAQDSLAAQLSKLPVSGELTLTSESEACDEDEALRVLDREVNASAEHAPEMWRHCQVLYACSPSTSAFLAESFKSGAKFLLGYADLRKLGKKSRL